MKIRFINLACIVLLVFGQQLAFVHAAWHAGGHGVVQPTGKTGKSDSSLQGDLCTLHGAFNQVLSSVPGGFVPPAPPLSPVCVPSLRCDCVPAVAILFPLSRSPPVRA